MYGLTCRRCKKTGTFYPSNREECACNCYHENARFQKVLGDKKRKIGNLTTPDFGLSDWTVEQHLPDVWRLNLLNPGQMLRILLKSILFNKTRVLHLLSSRNKKCKPTDVDLHFSKTNDILDTMSFLRETVSKPFHTLTLIF